VTGRSRSTQCPGSRRARLVRPSASRDRSNESPSSPRSTTVRHTPLTAIDAPVSDPSRTVRHATEIPRGEIERTEPSSSTIPVNIRLHLQIPADVPDRTDPYPERVGDRGYPFAAEDA